MRRGWERESPFAGTAAAPLSQGPSLSGREETISAGPDSQPRPVPFLSGKLVCKATARRSGLMLTLNSSSVKILGGRKAGPFVLTREAASGESGGFDSPEVS
jgi:hypothetical protein